MGDKGLTQNCRFGIRRCSLSCTDIGGSLGLGPSNQSGKSR